MLLCPFSLFHFVSCKHLSVLEFLIYVIITNFGDTFQVVPLGRNVTKLFKLIPGGLFYTLKFKNSLTFILQHRNVALEIHVLC